MGEAGENKALLCSAEREGMDAGAGQKVVHESTAHLAGLEYITMDG
ncbi:hypothetical protein [Gynuella sp.]